MANRAKWPDLGIQPQNVTEHATQLIAEATALLTLDRGRRQKLPDALFEAFLNSTVAYAKEARDQPSSHEIRTHARSCDLSSFVPPRDTYPLLLVPEPLSQRRHSMIEIAVMCLLFSSDNF